MTPVTLILESGPSTDTNLTLDNNLIIQVHNNPILWDSTRNDYRNKAKRDAVWRDIGVQLHASADECVNRWRTVRERFGRELRRKNKSSATGTSEDGESKWPHMLSMSFLLAHIRPRKSTLCNVLRQSFTTSSSVESPSTPSMVTIAPVHQIYMSHDILNTDNADGVPELSNDDSIASVSDVPSPPLEANLGPTPPKKRRHEPTSALLAEVNAARSTMERLTDILAADASTSQVTPPPRRSRFQSLCDMMIERYTSLPNNLKDEFDINVLTLLVEFTQRSGQLLQPT